MHFLYILRSKKDDKFYIGTTSNLARRIRQHNLGQSKSTRYRLPFIIVYKEAHSTKSSAMKREWYFKNTAEGNKLMRKLVNIKT